MRHQSNPLRILVARRNNANALELVGGLRRRTTLQPMQALQSARDRAPPGSECVAHLGQLLVRERLVTPNQAAEDAHFIHQQAAVRQI